MQSLKTVTGGIRDLNNVHEIMDLLAPKDPRKLYSAIERKAAGWAVMDADTRLNEGSAREGKGAKGDHKGAHSATIPCKHFAKGTCARGDKCRFSHKSLDSTSGGKGKKGKKSNSERSVQEVWKNHESATLGKIVSRDFFLFCASCVDVNSCFIAT